MTTSTADHVRDVPSSRAPSRLRALASSLASVDHKVTGVRIIVTAFVFFALGGLEALVMRLQLARPSAALVTAAEYDQIFTTHGSTMMFLFAVPVFQGLATYFVPLMVGTKNTAFPRLAAYGYWTYLLGGVLLYVAFVLQNAPDAGWFSYVPLATLKHSAGKGVDIWAQMISFTELSSLALAVNNIVTALKHRAPGMSIDRVPLFVWASVVASFMIVFAMPAIMLASSMLALDRLVNTRFFDVARGGDAILWQHLFWFFGHPEVYIIFIPALGLLSTVIESMTRRPIFGYLAMTLSLVATAFLGFGLWVHHMFATGLPQLGESFFTAASMLIAVPTGVQIFCWLATIYLGRPRALTPFLYAAGFFLVFVMGGLTGVMVASVPLNLQVHDTFFVVAHLHYVLIGGSVFPLLGAIHLWLPKMSGRMPSEALGRTSFAFVFVGFNLTFFPMHVLGMRGMPRRVYTYTPETGWADLNLLATAGAFVLGAGVLIFVWNVLRTVRSGPVAPSDPWGGPTLEWATRSPPPPHNFDELPTVRSREPLWSEAEPKLGKVVGLEPDQALVTTLVDALPDNKEWAPGPTLAPLLAALATGGMLVGVIFTPWALPIGIVPITLAFLVWGWPRRDLHEPYFEKASR